MRAEEAMAEIWGVLCPDCGPNDYESIVKAIKHLATPTVLRESKIVGDLRKLDMRRMPAIAALLKKNDPTPDHLRACILEIVRVQNKATPS